ncbi:NAD(P)-dependent oxidoreductase [Glaciimonas immobilis]|nr:NAD(P)-dependent oxidoreductase [Glaciimonas immobilis]
MNVTFIGVGAIGLPMALRIQAAGHAVTGVDVSLAGIANATKNGVDAVSGFALAPKGDIVIVMVATSQQLAALVSDVGSAASGQLWVVMSTVGPDSVREQGNILRAAGARVVDAPVTGGTARAKTGDLVIFASGSGEDIEAALPVLEAMGNVRQTGERLGDGQSIKVVNQHLCAVHIAAAAEALGLARSLGLDQQKAHNTALKILFQRQNTGAAAVVRALSMSLLYSLNLPAVLCATLHCTTGKPRESQFTLLQNHTH